jgi:adenine-specific DNA-methyltransferase
MSKKQKLELTWVGKENRPRLEPRILLEDSEKSYHAAHRVGDEDFFDNRLIFGDNLLALKALEQEFSGRIKCAYIDPPFNTQQAFDHYEDGLEHSLWLSLMRDRIELLHRLIAQSGTLFVHIDDNEIGYLIVLLDEIFGRQNRISVITFKQGAATGHKAINPGVVSTSNFILIYAKDKSSWSPKRIFTGRPDRDRRYGQYIVNFESDFPNWKFSTLVASFADYLRLPEKGLKKILGDEYESKIAQFVHENPNKVARLARPDYKSVSQDARDMIDYSKRHPDRVHLLKRNGFSPMYFVRGERILFYADKLKEIDGELVAGEPLTSIWDDLLSNNLHNEGGVSFPKGKKPEMLIKRCLELCTEPNDWVLDSFAGSGTTGATAHKMRRRWIMIELQDHCNTHIVPRLQRVVEGTDLSGVSKATNWQGGGGFRYFKLAPSLLETDKWGREVISKTYNAEMLAEALCKIEGFTYAPSDIVYWQHGYSTERDFIYVTTQTLGVEQLQQLSEEVGAERSLLVLCSAFRGNADRWLNLTVKKIPNHIRSRCEWGHDDYSLNVENLPKAPPRPERDVEARDRATREPDLFGATNRGSR